MVATDRILHAFSRAVPGALLALVRAVAPGVVPRGMRITPFDLADTRLEAPPPPLEADWVGRAAPREIFHFEFQGYGERRFPERVFRYHLRLVDRYPGCRVHTIALWTIEPPRAQLAAEIERGGVRIRITPLVLPLLPAWKLLRRRSTACFAAGADPGRMSTRALCDRVARALRNERYYRERQVALMVATLRGRDAELIEALKRARLRDLPLIFLRDAENRAFDRGLKKGERRGIKTGVVTGLQRAVLDVYEARFGKVPAELGKAIRAARSEPTLQRWHKLAVTVSAAEFAKAVLGKRKR